ncbi:MAG TPA: SRPBCC family protein [Gemmatimonadales bacterium]|nr:SRPBCC family protein [Gemmatimonadales bacterium]
MMGTMLKWILIIIVLMMLVVMGTCWYGYRKMTEGGDTASITIATTPDRIWRYLTIPDSFAVWQDSTAVLGFSDDSLLSVGDSVRMGSGGQASLTQQKRMVWVMERALEPSVIAWAASDDSTGMVIVRRTDSLVPMGDSVQVLSRFEVPAMHPLATGDSIGGLGRKLMAGAGRIAASAGRIIAEQDLARLKARLER